MNMISSGNEIKKQNRSRIIKFVYSNGAVSRQDIAKTLGYSLPTVYANIIELVGMELLSEVGEYGSTGGRKAKTLAIRKNVHNVVGVAITKRHIRLLLLDLSGEVLAEDHFRCEYEDTMEYYRLLGAHLERFLTVNSNSRQRMIGVGVSIPGIVDSEKGVVQRSHILNITGVSLSRFQQFIPYSIIFDNDANCAAFAEVDRNSKNTAYFSLSSTIGGAIYQHGSLCPGDNLRAGEFGHMLLRPGGKRCYCGKYGCMDAYCSVNALLDDPDGSLEDFFDQLAQGNPIFEKRWDAYLEDLAIAITNIRMILDCDIVLGGYIGGYIEQYMGALAGKVARYNVFDQDTTYIKTGRHKRLSFAIGAAQMMIYRYFDMLESSMD